MFSTLLRFFDAAQLRSTCHFFRDFVGSSASTGPHHCMQRLPCLQPAALGA
jgi:hypothetical protein